MAAVANYKYGHGTLAWWLIIPLGASLLATTISVIMGINNGSQKLNHQHEVAPVPSFVDTLRSCKCNRPLHVRPTWCREPQRKLFMLPLPPQYAWFEPVLIASIVVFVVDLIGNSITFSNRYVSALVSAFIFAAVFGGLTYYGYGNVSMSVKTTAAATAPAQK